MSIENTSLQKTAPNSIAEMSALASGAPPIFVTGMPRSGTTLVSMLLNGHSRIAIAPETHYFRKYLRKGNRRKCLSTPPRFETFVDFFLRGSELEAFNFTSEQLDDLRQRILGSEKRNHSIVLGSVLQAYARKQGKMVCGEKTPSNVYYVDEIIEMFPNCRIVHVIRDPRDVVLSLSKVSWHRGNLIQHAAEWRRAVGNAIESSYKYPSQTLIVKYEDVLDRSAIIVKEMCEFLKVDVEYDMLSFHQHAEPNFDVSSEPWKANTLSPIDRTNAMKWKKELSPAKCAVVEGMLEREMKELGYEWSGYSTDAISRLIWTYLHGQNLYLSVQYWTKAAWHRWKGPY